MNGLKRHDLVQVEIEDLAFGGLGVGRRQGFVVFVEQALPGELVTARILKKKSNHARAVIHSIDRPSPDRIEKPRCELFGQCGGCTWQHFPYERQTEWKQKQAVATLKHIGGMDVYEMLPIIGSPAAWNYRNKMEYSFGTDDSGAVILGFHRPARFDRILEVPRCHIHPEPFDAALRVLTEHARRHSLTAYDPRRHEGFLRHAVMRQSETTGESLLVLITDDGDLPRPEGLADDLRAAVPGFKGMIWGIHRGVADVARIDEERWRWGEPELIEIVNGLTFRISAQAFFQTNTRAAATLYREAVEMAQLDADDFVLDAYCGMGAIGLHCASRVTRIVGLESVTEAIWDARENAARNGIGNATFLAAPLPAGLELARHAAGRPFSRVIIDPPRGGMDKRSLTGLIGLRAPVFVYVSCNPATLARDLVSFAQAGYQLEAVRPLDLFPQTYHIEMIVRLRLPG